MTADELDFAAAVENFIGKPIERKKLDGFNYTYTALLEDKPVKSVLQAQTRRTQAPQALRRGKHDVSL